MFNYNASGDSSQNNKYCIIKHPNIVKRKSQNNNKKRRRKEKLFHSCFILLSCKIFLKFVWFTLYFFIYFVSLPFSFRRNNKKLSVSVRKRTTFSLIFNHFPALTEYRCNWRLALRHVNGNFSWISFFHMFVVVFRVNFDVDEALKLLDFCAVKFSLLGNYFNSFSSLISWRYP